MDAATIEERLMPYGSKTLCFCPSESKATRIKASLSSWGQALSSGMILRQRVGKYLFQMARPDPRPPRRANEEWR